MSQFSKSFLPLLILTLFSCSNPTEQTAAPTPEIWGDDSTSYSVEIYHPNGKRYFKYSDLSTDTTSMKLDAIKWYKGESNLILASL